MSGQSLGHIYVTAQTLIQHSTHVSDRWPFSFTHQEFAEATDLASLAIELRPDNYEGYYARAKSLMELNSIDEALSDAREAINRSASASVDIQQILLRLQRELYQRSIADASSVVVVVTESIDTTTDLWDVPYISMMWQFHSNAHSFGKDWHCCSLCSKRERCVCDVWCWILKSENQKRRSREWRVA